MDDFPEWEESDIQLTALQVHPQGTIEDDGTEMLQVDFANKIIGGGVLGHGCVQEEIRFVINTECIISRLFTTTLRCNEAVLIKGAERYSNYSGYSKTFQWTGNYIDSTERDSLQRRSTIITAIDALRLNNPMSQYSREAVERELNKAYAGFYFTPLEGGTRRPIATGNWGCGAFGGNRELKSLIQLMAASLHGRVVHYYTFGDVSFGSMLAKMYIILSPSRLMSLL